MENQELDFANSENLALKVFSERAYLDYSMYVILDRALPQIADGLKPVQRRIVYAMSELSLNSGAKYKKSARTVGDVIGKFHPHGDSACYEAMVHMAQSFSYRYPLVDGQGNWGSQDEPKSFAAMRYTESRLTPYADVLLSELGQGTVEWTSNFDGTMDEPQRLPSRLPNVLLNGASGIAVGMSTDIPPHNLREIASACVHLLESPNATVEDLCRHIPAPDWPTGAEIISTPEEIRSVYETGGGTLRTRATYEMESGDIVVTALPFQTSGAKVLEQIASQMRAKNLPMVEELRDESDHENPVRLVITPRSRRVDTDALMAHLFATTDLERTHRTNFNVIGLDGRPKVHTLGSMLKEWLTFRTETVRRRLQFRLDKVERRLHILDGLLVAFLNIDEVIRIIREHDHPRQSLMDRFALSEIQADAILDLRLRNLARLEEVRIKAEQSQLGKERDLLNRLLGSKARMRRLIRDELLQDAETYGDARRCELVERPPARAMEKIDLVPSEPITVVLSQRGWARSAKGHEIDPSGLAYKSGDGYLAAARGRSNQQAIFLDSTGRAYSLPAHSLPSARGQGEPLTGRLNPPDGATFAGVAIGEAEQRYLLASSAGYGFVARLADMHSRNRAGKTVLTVPAGGGVLAPVTVDADAERVAVAGNLGHLLIFDLADLPEMSRGKGNKMLGIPAAKFKSGDEYMVAVAVLGAGQALEVSSGQRRMTLKARDQEKYYGARGRRGALLPRGWRKTDALQGG